jgi:hypothetical protein
MYHVAPYMSAGVWLLGLLVCGAFILLIAWGIAWIVRRDGHRYGPSMPPPSMPPLGPQPVVDPAIQILRERFARGEIGEADFVTASRALGAPVPSAGPPASPPS